MTNLLNVPTKIKEFFTLKSEKNNTWLEYLYSEAKYVNGSVYVHTNVPNYHNQELDGFVVNQNNSSTDYAFVYIKGDNFIQTQIDNTEIFIDGEFKNFTKTLVDTAQYKGLRITLNITSNGLLTVNIPSYNTPTDIYKGVYLQRVLTNQDVVIVGTPRKYTSDGKTYLEVIYYIVNPLVSQQLKLSSIDRNNRILDTKTVSLNSNSGNTNGISFTLELKKTSYVKWKLELLPMCKNNNCYLGKFKEGTIP